MTLPAPLPRAVTGVLRSASIGMDHSAPTPRPQMRRYEVQSLMPEGGIAQTSHIAPALPLFEDAFCAFSRGTLVDTDKGAVAIEDLLPGDGIVTGDGTVQPLVWKGRTTLAPGRPGPQGRNMRLTRIMADSFGIQRPVSYVLAGPSARLLHTPDHLRALSGGKRILTPVQQFQDGMNVIETAPPTAVELFHICLPRHALIRVAGLAFETYHPGPTALRTLSQAMRSVYLNLFPHIEQEDGFGELVHGRSGDGPVNARDA
ncbi:Hint domain-containing protein [Rhodobacteraceae bacterium F11138]|nr:Hint domain-containing protein [Rhodobacteraceae bacterium F11138]